jgi:hypothetical protein
MALIIDFLMELLSVLLLVGANLFILTVIIICVKSYIMERIEERKKK